MPEKTPAFWIALAVTLFALFASARVLIEIVRLRRIEQNASEAERKAASEEIRKKSPRLRIPPKPTLE